MCSGFDAVTFYDTDQMLYYSKYTLTYFIQNQNNRIRKIFFSI